MSNNVLVYIDHFGGKVRPATLPGIRCGQDYAKTTGGELHLCVIGKDVAAVVDEVKGFGATKIHVFDNACFEHYVAEIYAPAVTEAQEAAAAGLVCGVAGSTTKDLMPRVAAKLDAGMASDVMAIVGPKTFKRPMWAGNVIATVEIDSDVCVATIRGTEFDAPVTGGEAAVNALGFTVDPSSAKTRFVALEEVKSERPDLTTADVIVSGGRGVKGVEGFGLIEKLADQLGAGVGASRAVCDAGWCANDLQIGQTGKVVAPNLYFAVGISGAIQHLAGMKGSRVIVAINKDPEAPIFQVADYGLVADLFKAVPELMETLK